MNENTQLMIIPKPLIFDKPFKLVGNSCNYIRDIYDPMLDLLYYLSKLDPDINDLIRSKCEEILKGE